MVNFVVSIVLLNEIGVVGSAIGADAAYLIYVPAHFWICKQLIGLHVRPIALTFARYADARGRDGRRDDRLRHREPDAARLVRGQRQRIADLLRGACC